MKEVQMMDINEVKPYFRNTKIHTSTQARKIAGSIADFGWDQPIVVDTEMVIIKGHGRLEAAKFLEMKEVPVLVRDDMTIEEIQASRIMDNKSAESEWDEKILWDELEDLKEVGITAMDMGFDTRALRRIFPDEDEFQKNGGVGTDTGKEEENGQTSMCTDDLTKPEKETFIAYHKGEDAYLRRLSMGDYLDSHDKILVGFSSGKDSMAALIWILENCDPSKVVAYYTNPGHGVDWPHSLFFVRVFEKIMGIKILMAGVCDPGAMGKWEDCVVQHAFPGMAHGCWIESLIKIPQATALLRQEDLIKREGLSVVQILAIRHAESPNRAKTYPDRGVLKDTGNHFASPIIAWSDGDVGKYLDDRDIFLHSAYENEGRMGCLMCPKGSPTGAVAIRKKYPKHWAKICEWYALGGRKRGQIAFTIQKWLACAGDLPPQKLKRFSGDFSALALSGSDLEDKIEEITGEKLPMRPFLSELYTPGVTEMRNDLREDYAKS